MRVSGTRNGCFDLNILGHFMKIHRGILAKLTDYLLPALMIITGLISVAWVGFLVWAVFYFIARAAN
jgi:hypothetical protein